MASVSLAAASGDCSILQGAVCCWGHSARIALILSTPIQYSYQFRVGKQTSRFGKCLQAVCFLSSLLPPCSEAKCAGEGSRSGMCQADGAFVFHSLPGLLLDDSFTDKVAYFVFPIPPNCMCTESDISLSLAKGPC